MNAPEFPTPWQRKTLWAAVTAVAVVTIGAIAVGLIWLLSEVLGFLQPLLVPFAVAAVLAYLLEPAVSKIVSWGTSRHRAVFFVFAVVTITTAGILLWIVPALSTQSINLARKVPRYTHQAQLRLLEFSNYTRQRYGVPLLPPQPAPAAQAKVSADATADSPPGAPDKAATTTPLESGTTGTADVPPPAANESTTPGDQRYDLQKLISGDWLQDTLREVTTHLVKMIRDSLGGFLGVLGFLLSLIIVPIYLFYFLIEGPNIEKSWSDYLPLRASAFKDEVVSVLSEINGYLIAFFRGQLVVSLINGAITSVGLVSAGLEFGLLIGLVLCFLGIVPYLGIAMCWIVSIVIASVQGGSWCVPSHPWWVFPLVISVIFFVVHYVDGLFVTPKIVGESVGLHPLTVIFSVFAWSLLMGGLLGAILAVPMTATVKVLLRRYVWARQFPTLEPLPAAVVELPSAPKVDPAALPEPETVVVP